MKQFKLQLLRQTLLISRKKEVHDAKCKKCKKKQTNKQKQLAIKNKYMKPNIFSNDNEF